MNFHKTNLIFLLKNFHRDNLLHVTLVVCMHFNFCSYNEDFQIYCSIPPLVILELEDIFVVWEQFINPPVTISFTLQSDPGLCSQ